MIVAIVSMSLFGDSVDDKLCIKYVGKATSYIKKFVAAYEMGNKYQTERALKDTERNYFNIIEYCDSFPEMEKKTKLTIGMMKKKMESVK